MSHGVACREMFICSNLGQNLTKPELCKDTASNLGQVASFEAEFNQSNSVNKSSKNVPKGWAQHRPFYSYLLSDLAFQ